MKDQFVIACVESPESAAVVLPWARHFAERLNHKGLMLLHVASDQESVTDDQWLKELGVPYVSMRGDWRTAIEGLPTAFNGILAVTAVDSAAPRTSLTHPKTLLRQFKNCKIAYLVVSGQWPVTSGQWPVTSDQCADARTATAPLTTDHWPLATALTMTHRREGKEKLVWASYLARFLGSRVTIAHPDYSDGDLRMRWRNNMRFVDKMFAPLGITYNTSILTKANRVDQAVLDELQPDLLIARTTDTRERDFIDWLLPLPEYRLLTHPSHTPLLFLNPRDDLYILCD